MKKTQLIEALKPVFKEMGWRKNGNTWALAKQGLVIIFNVQGSYYDKDAYYINFGVYLTAFGEKKFPKEHECQIRERLREGEYDVGLLINAARLWNEKYGDISLLRQKAVSGSLPAFTTAAARAYLLSGRI